MKKQFNSNGIFWQLIIEIVNDEVLIYKNGEKDPFYYFETSRWYDTFKRHMADKNWFTQEMSDFITENIQLC